MPRMLSRLSLAALCATALAGCATTPASAPAKPLAAALAPAADHHQHLFSPSIIALIGSPTNGLKEIPPEEVIAHLDRAGIQRAAVLSVAYMFARPGRNVDNEVEKVRAENDWTGAQAAKYPQRLRAFCGLNPLSTYALDELARCAANPNTRHGLKLHFGNSDVQLENPEHLARMKEIFAAANRHRMAIAVHMRASISKKRPYGAQQARLFLDELMPMAPDIVVQVAHFAGAGPGYEDPPAREVMRTFAEAAERGEPNARRVWFDVASIATPSIKPEDAREMVQRIRQVGVDRVLYGTDATTPGNMTPQEGWAAFRALPLEPREVARIAANVAPYLR